jgi:hypothetical protein
MRWLSLTRKKLLEAYPAPRAYLQTHVGITRPAHESTVGILTHDHQKKSPATEDPSKTNLSFAGPAN